MCGRGAELPRLRTNGTADLSQHGRDVCEDGARLLAAGATPAFGGQMTNQELAEVLRNAIKQEIGEAQDNAYRAKMQFKGLSEEQMERTYGRSSQSCKTILLGYIAREVRAKKAEEFLNEMLRREGL
jgi:hypothetical protein